MASFSKDEKRVSRLVELIDTEEDVDAEEKQLSRLLLKKSMSRLARHSRSELTIAEKELLRMDSVDYGRIIHSK